MDVSKAGQALKNLRMCLRLPKLSTISMMAQDWNITFALEKSVCLHQGLNWILGVIKKKKNLNLQLHQ
jgi:hypothetical protein